MLWEADYLIGIVKFKAIEHLKKRRKDAEGLSGFREDAPLDEQTPCSGDELRDWRHEAYEVALAQLMADPSTQELHKCVFVRVAVNGDPPERVAAAYGISRNNVDQIKNRMVAKLRELISRMTDEE